MASTTERLGVATAPSVASEYKLKIPIHARYENWISGEYTPPVRGQYFSNPSPITGQPLCEVARSTKEDVDRAIDAAHAAAVSWNHTTPAFRAQLAHRKAVC